VHNWIVNPVAEMPIIVETVNVRSVMNTSVSTG